MILHVHRHRLRSFVVQLISVSAYQQAHTSRTHLSMFQDVNEDFYLNSLFRQRNKLSNADLGRLVVEISRSHTIRHTHTHTLGLTPLDEGSGRRRGY